MSENKYYYKRLTIDKIIDTYLARYLFKQIGELV